MFTTGFSMDLTHVDALNEAGLSTTSRWMLDLARKHDAAIVGSVGVRDVAGEASNRMWMATPEGELHVYDKRHLFTLAGEHRAYRPGIERVEATWRGWNILFQVCYDLRFPAFARNNGSTPYDLALYVANWPEPRREAWRTLLQARAIENQCFVVGVNRSGTDANGHHYAGDSMIVRPAAGHLLSDAEMLERVPACYCGDPRRVQDMLPSGRSFPFLEDVDRFGVR